MYNKETASTTYNNEVRIVQSHIRLINSCHSERYQLVQTLVRY